MSIKISDSICGILDLFLRRSLVSRRVARELVSRFGGSGGHNLDEKKGELGYGLIHYGLISNLRPERILCVGSMKGFIPAVCAKACQDIGGGHVDFVDAGYDRGDPENWGGIGFWTKTDPVRHFSQLGLKGLVTTHIMTSSDFAANAPKRIWDYIYIDADHSYQGVKSDYLLFWPRLKKGGYMVFHDVLLKRHTDPAYDRFGVWKFWKELKSGNKIVIPFTYSDTLPSGLGIVQKM